MDDNNEQLLEKAGNMKEIRAAAAKHPDSVASPKICLTQVLSRLRHRIPHMPEFLTCCTLAENGSVFFGFLRLRDG